MAEAKNIYQEVLKENEALKDMCECLKKENNDLKVKCDTNCTRQSFKIKNLTEKNITLQEQNERVCKENEELKEKLAKYKNCIDCLKTIIEVFKER